MTPSQTPSMLSSLLTLALAPLVVAGCAVTDADVEDGIDDAFDTGGKADGVIAEGSPEAIGVLRAANEASLKELDDAAQMSSRTAGNIVDRRNGADNVDGTADDQRFATLAALDAVPYVGPAAFDQLLAYAQSRGWVPPVNPFPTCGGKPRVPTTGPVVFTTATRSAFARDCDAFGTCTAWQSAGPDVTLTLLDRNEIWTDAKIWVDELGSNRVSVSGGVGEDVDIFSMFGTGYPSGGYAQLDANGTGRGFMNASHRSKGCNAFGCSDWYYQFGAHRPVTLQLGATCLTITDDTPASSYGHQVKNVIRMTW